jgi:hypothetical protein
MADYSANYNPNSLSRWEATGFSLVLKPVRLTNIFRGSARIALCLHLSTMGRNPSAMSQRPRKNPLTETLDSLGLTFSADWLTRHYCTKER